MKIASHSVVVQWGAGHAYFLGHYNSLQKASDVAQHHSKYLTARQKGKRGAKHTVYVLMTLFSVPAPVTEPALSGSLSTTTKE